MKIYKWSITLLLVLCINSTAFGKAVNSTDNSVTIDQNSIDRVLSDYIERNKSFLPQAEIRLRNIQLAKPFTLPKGKLDIEVIPSDPAILKSHRFTLIFRVDGRVEKNIAVRAKLEAIAPVAVASGDLQRGSIINRRDINLVRMDIVPLRNPSFDPKELIGKKVKRSLRLGKPIDRTSVEFPSLVKRGDIVSMVVRKGALTVTAKGVARRNGKKGAWIKVRNTNSQKEILCKVVAPGLVKVEI